MKNKAKEADFIAAYMYSYGATKKDARKAYKDASPEYIAALVDGYRRELRKAFYND